MNVYKSYFSYYLIFKNSYNLKKNMGIKLWNSNL